MENQEEILKQDVFHPNAEDTHGFVVLCFGVQPLASCPADWLTRRVFVLRRCREEARTLLGQGKKTQVGIPWLRAARSTVGAHAASDRFCFLIVFQLFLASNLFSVNGKPNCVCAARGTGDGIITSVLTDSRSARCGVVPSCWCRKNKVMHSNDFTHAHQRGDALNLKRLQDFHQHKN